MPTSARKSSVGAAARRGPQKPHVPYREGGKIGKKTGIAVELVQRKSDGFEPFEDVIGQADKRTPPKVKNTRKKKRISSPVYADEDEDGEMSMELDDSTTHSPMSFFTNNRYPGGDGTSRVASSSRRTTRLSDVDFDQLPSHRPRKSGPNSSAPGPSTLSQSHIPSPDPDDDPDEGGVDGSFEDYAEPEDDYAPQNSPRRTSFTEIDQDEDEDEDGDEELDDAQTEVAAPARNLSKDKGKGRMQTPEEDEDDPVEPEMEDAIAQGLEDVEQDEASEDEEEPRNKKPKTVKPQEKRHRGRPPKSVKVARERSPTPPGVRRGRRHRYRPLEWWRQEKVVYDNKDEGLVLVPHIKEIIRIPKEPIQPLGKQKRKRKATTPRAKSKTPAIYNPEEGWDKDTDAHGIVVDFLTKEEVERRVAYTAKMVTPKAAANNDWLFDKVFGDGDFIAAGQVVIPPKATKPSKGTKDNTYIFYVIEGAIELKVHETSFILCTGAMFLVPRGNTYYIENISDRNAKLFFTQARKIKMTEGEEEAAALLAPLMLSDRSKTTGPSIGGGRSSSAGAAPYVNGFRGSPHGPARRAASTKV